MLHSLVEFVLIISTLLQFCSCFSSLRPNDSKTPIYHINNVKHVYTSESPSHLENAMNETMILTFETESILFSLDLKLNTKIYGKHTKIYGKNNNGEIELQPRRFRSFVGNGIITNKNNNNNNNDNNDGEHATCTVTFYGDLRFHCLCISDIETYTIDWKELQNSDSESNDVATNHIGIDTNSGMVLIKGSEAIKNNEKENEDNENVTGKQKIKTKTKTYTKQQNKNNNNKNNNNNNNMKDKNTKSTANGLFSYDNEKELEKHQRSFLKKFRITNNNNNNNNNDHSRSLLNDQSQLVPFTDCFDGQYDYIHQIYIGIVTDISFNAVYNNDNDAIITAIESLFNDATGANMIYYYQLNIMLSLGTLYIGDTYLNDGTFTLSPATFDSSLTISNRLYSFRDWRKEYYDSNKDETNGIWHLMTNYHPPAGTVGIAYIGVLCSYSYGVGLSNYINPAWTGTGTWETWAHEVGHNFGANHAFEDGQGTTGGIMDYGNGLYPLGTGAYQFHPTYNRDEICDQISYSLSTLYRWSSLSVDKCWHQYTEDNNNNNNNNNTPYPTTPDPTQRPTPRPTPRPTTRPTDRPTTRPTNRPTERPTNRPTQRPTDGPTNNPTNKPTNRPTNRPTIHPTEKPTDRPTNPPTNPTNQPTIRPSIRPTEQPTHDPISSNPRGGVSGVDIETFEPTSKPTIVPSNQPTNTPTVKPTMTPTRDPTNQPTNKPTHKPTNLPTVYPTDAPTDKPTGVPTMNPTDDDEEDEELETTNSSNDADSGSSTTTCGNGIVDSDEVCDINAIHGNCCNDDCMGYNTNTIDCWMINPIIDAAFKDNDGNVYLFQGKYYAKYSQYYYGYSRNTPNNGYPKLIENSFPIRSFTQDITAIAYGSDSEVYVFQGMKYVKIDMLSGEYNGYPRTFTDDFNVLTDIKECGSITGAYMYPYYGTTIVTFCDRIAGVASPTYRFAIKYDISQFGASSDERVTAVYNEPGKTTFYWFTTNIAQDTGEDSNNNNDDDANNDNSRRRQRSMMDDSSDNNNDNNNDDNQWYSNSQGSGNNVRSFDDDDDETYEESSCYDPNCARCDSDNIEICYQCESDDDYILYDNSKCLYKNILLYLDFDINSANSIDYNFIIGGKDTLDDCTYVNDGVTGKNATAMYFDGYTKLELIPLNYNTFNQYVESFRVSFRFKPESITYNKLISIDNENMAIYLINDVNNNNNYNEYNIKLKIGNDEFISSHDNGLKMNEWNVVELTYFDDTFKIYINGDVKQEAYKKSTMWANTNIELKFNDWYIGDNDGYGIHGALDQLSFTKL